MKKYIGFIVIGILISACKLPYMGRTTENKDVPNYYFNSTDTTVEDSTNTAESVKWKDFFKDTLLAVLIDSALKNNQELNITLQEILISNNEVMARKGEYLPTVGVGLSAGAEKTPRYTRNGASDEANEIMPGKATPAILPNFMVGFHASWEIDIWGKLHNAKKAAYERYLASVQGKNFLITNLVAEIASTYYELEAYDSQLKIISQYIKIQENALKIAQLQKLSANTTELAVRRFEAELYHTRSRQNIIQQRIVEAENRINFLVGRFPQHVDRNTDAFMTLRPDSVYTGFPVQLLDNRTDIQQAELQLQAAKLDVKVAKKQFYPSLSLDAGVGYQAFNPAVWFSTPMSIVGSLVGNILSPLINRKKIKAAYYSANSKQIQAIYNYERAILKAYIEVSNQISNIRNLKQSFKLKSKQVSTLNEAIKISFRLFKSAEGNYMDVLFTQRDALGAKFDLIETQENRLVANIKLYRALGGGWN